MGQPYIGEIRMFAGAFAPAGWMKCEGQILPISENSTMFSVIGTRFGGDGINTFGLPDLRGRAPMHFSSRFPLAQSAGQEKVTLNGNQIPSHTHVLQAANGLATESSPVGAFLGDSYSVTPYVNTVGNGDMHTSGLAGVGGNQPHENMQPFICLTYIISLYGIFPST